METLITALIAQIPAAVGLGIWLVKRKAATPTMTERFIGHLEKQSDVTAALANRFDLMDAKLDQVLVKLNGDEKPARRTRSA